MAKRRPSLVTNRADSSLCAAPASRTSKSAGASVSTARPFASAATTSMETTRGAGAGLCAPATTAIDTATASASLPGDAESKQLFRLAAVAGGLDLEDVFSRRHSGQRQLDLLFAGLRRRNDRQL